MIPGLLFASSDLAVRPDASGGEARDQTNRRKWLPSQLPGSWAQDPGCTAVLFEACLASAAS
jgi:hypothetical protein